MLFTAVLAVIDAKGDAAMVVVVRKLWQLNATECNFQGYALPLDRCWVSIVAHFVLLQFTYYTILHFLCK
jgi:hypothetical protein